MTYPFLYSFLYSFLYTFLYLSIPVFVYLCIPLYTSLYHFENSNVTFILKPFVVSKSRPKFALKKQLRAALPSMQSR